MISEKLIKLLHSKTVKHWPRRYNYTIYNTNQHSYLNQIPLPGEVDHIYQENFPPLPSRENRILQTSRSQRTSGSAYSGGGSGYGFQIWDHRQNTSIPERGIRQDIGSGRDSPEGQYGISGTTEEGTRTSRQDALLTPEGILNNTNPVFYCPFPPDTSVPPPTSIILDTFQNEGNPAHYLMETQGDPFNPTIRNYLLGNSVYAPVASSVPYVPPHQRPHGEGEGPQPYPPPKLPSRAVSFALQPPVGCERREREQSQQPQDPIPVRIPTYLPTYSNVVTIVVG
jgi:hypothetical protein